MSHSIKPLISGVTSPVSVSGLLAMHARLSSRPSLPAVSTSGSGAWCLAACLDRPRALPAASRPAQSFSNVDLARFRRLPCRRDVCY
ncbi:hypothetical protein ElyMa_000739600 [Elysia marginata]|uniref:Secreted protein n=1 Tax=Elysia marginata TaxID=1093978 RepID=A0AAV4GPA9_9GAST|nr:hypothetical protein ElyMa_000739600 [Elysia marginata]